MGVARRGRGSRGGVSRAGRGGASVIQVLDLVLNDVIFSERVVYSFIFSNSLKKRSD